MDIIQLISSLGFPIVACIFVAVYTNKLTENFRADIKDMQKEHKDEILKVTDAVNNNSLVLQKLCDKLDTEVKEDANK